MFIGNSTSFVLEDEGVAKLRCEAGDHGLRDVAGIVVGCLEVSHSHDKPCPKHVPMFLANCPMSLIVHPSASLSTEPCASARRAKGPAMVARRCTAQSVACQSDQENP